jgi:RHS repeat-associated protein
VKIWLAKNPRIRLDFATTSLHDSTLRYLGVREYDPKLGKFVAVDPLVDLSDPQALNGYAYSNSQPRSVTLMGRCSSAGRAVTGPPNPAARHLSSREQARKKTGS